MSKRKQIWKDIVGFENIYEVSNFGNIRNKISKKLRIPGKTDKGYLQLCLYDNKRVRSFRVHRIVALAFLPNLNNLPDINHKDGNKENNFVNNLEWSTRKDNMVHAVETKLHNCGKIVFQYDKQGNLIKKWNSTMEIQRTLGYFNSRISANCLGVKGIGKYAYGYLWRYEEEKVKV